MISQSAPRITGTLSEIVANRPEVQTLADATDIPGVNLEFMVTAKFPDGAWFGNYGVHASSATLRNLPTAYLGQGTAMEGGTLVRYGGVGVGWVLSGGPNIADDFGNLRPGVVLGGRRTPVGNAKWISSGYFVGIAGAKVGTSVAFDGATAYFSVPEVPFVLETTVAAYYTDTNNKGMPQILLHYTDNSNFMHLEVSPANGIITLYRNQAGTFTAIATIQKAMASGEQIPIKITVRGREIKIEIPGIDPFTYIEPIVDPTCNVGIRSGKSGSPPAPYMTWCDVKISTAPAEKLRWPLWTKDSVTSPVVGLGTVGAWDSTDVNNPTVFFDTANNRWTLNYSGYKTGANGVQHFGYAYSSSLNGPWTKYASNPVISADGTDGRWAFNGGIAFWNGYYWAVQGANDGKGLRVRRSLDAYVWDDLGIQWNLGGGSGSFYEGGVFDAFLRVTQDNRLQLWCGVATAGFASRKIAMTYLNADGTIIIPSSPFLTPPTNIFWNVAIGEPCVFVPEGKEGKEYLVCFDTTGNSSATAVRRVGMAISVDGGITWEYRVAASGPWGGGAWEANQNFDSHITYDAASKTMHMFYGGAPVAGGVLDIAIQIGHASTPWEDGSLLVS